MKIQEALAAGYCVGRDSQGWHIQRVDQRGGTLSPFVLRRDYPTCKEALADLAIELTAPDGVLPPPTDTKRHS